MNALLISIFFLGATSYALPAKVPLKTTAPPAANKISLTVWDWGSYYLPSVQESLINALSRQNINVKFQYPPTPLTTAPNLIAALNQGYPVDIIMPAMYFFEDRPDLASIVHPVPIDSIPRFKNIPAVIQELSPRANANSLSCVPTLGGFMNLFYKKDIAAAAPKNFSIFTNPQFKGKYAIPAYSPWYLGYVTYEILNTPLGDRFTVSSLRSPQFRQQFKQIVANAGLVYDNYTLDDPKFNKVSVLLGWGYRIPKTWIKPELTVPLPFYMDCMSITKSAAADKNKLTAFVAMADWFLRPENQNRLVSNIESFNMIKQPNLNKKEFYHGIKPAETAELKALLAEALATAKR